MIELLVAALALAFLGVILGGLVGMVALPVAVVVGLVRALRGERPRR